MSKDKDVCISPGRKCIFFGAKLVVSKYFLWFSLWPNSTKAFVGLLASDIKLWKLFERKKSSLEYR